MTQSRENVANGADAAGAHTFSDIYPDYSRSEVIADAVIHAIGIAVSIITFTTIYVYAFQSLSTPLNVALVIYGASVVSLFVLSASYHLTPFPASRPFLRLLDQSAIFFKIAGSYTPIVFMIDTAFGYIMLALIWSGAIMGAAGKLSSREMLDKHTVYIFLAMGWASVLLLWPIFQTLPTQDAILIVLGGAVYSAGVIFHQWDGLRFQNAIWHAFVLTASLLHLFAIADAAFAVGTVIQ
ncbi:MAG: hemolysin III family protein [Pseudomonadota bacterium]